MESLESMIAIVQIYINICKNVEVNIKINNFVEIKQLKVAYKIAYDWLNNNNLQILDRNI